MADSQLLDFLFGALAEATGRESWLARKRTMLVLDLSGADFTELNLHGYDLREAVLTTAVFLGADLSGADLTDADLSYADMRRTVLAHGCLDRADLRSTDLQYANLADADLIEANLSGARLCYSDLVGANLNLTDLTGTDLRGACLKYASLAGAHLEGADVAGADLSGCVLDDEAPMMLRNFDQAQVDDRKYREMRSHLWSEQRVTDLAVVGDRSAAKVSRGGVPASPSGPPLSGDVGPDPAMLRGIESELGAAIPTEADLATEEGCCRILGIDNGAPLAAITKAFRQKAKLYHPDKTLGKSEGEKEILSDMFHLVREAYELLSSKRAKPLVGVIWVQGVPVRDSAYAYTVQEYIALAKANPNHADLLYNLAWKYFDAGLFAEAIETYERVIGLMDGDPDAEFNLRIVKLCKTFDLSPDPAVNAS